MRYHVYLSAAGETLQKMRRSRWRRPGHGGSHVIFSAEGVREIVSVPAKRPIKPVYIRQFLALIESAVEVKENERENESNS
jgi:hypothetical protein